MPTSLIALVLCIGVLLESGFAKDKPAWLDGKVVAVGHVAAADGHQVPTATIVLYDPENSDPTARKRAWIVTIEAAQAKTMVDLSIVGATFKAYESRLPAGSLIIMRYIDKKGREQSEWHQIAASLSQNEIP